MEITLPVTVYVYVYANKCTVYVVICIRVFNCCIVQKQKSTPWTFIEEDLEEVLYLVWLRVYVCVHVCAYMCACVCVHSCMYVCSIYMYVHYPLKKELFGINII